MAERPKRKLSPKQKVFAEEYLKDLNSTQAAKRAGYSEKSAAYAGSHTLNVPEVKAQIQKNMDERSERTKIDSDYVLTTVKDTVERCRQAEPVMEWDPIAKEMVRTGEWKFDAANVLKGCDLLGKHLKLWDQAAPVNININLNELSDEQIDAEIAAFEKRLKK